jgi:hypothetical protein
MEPIPNQRYRIPQAVIKCSLGEPEFLGRLIPVALKRETTCRLLRGHFRIPASLPGSAMITNVETPTIIHSPSEFCQTSPGPEPNLYPSAKTRTRKRKIAPTPHGNNAFGRLGCRRCVQCRKRKQKVPPAHSSGLSQSVYMTPKTFSYHANSAVTEALRAARTIKSLVRLA